MHEFKRVLVANRGEIALRVIRALKALDIESVAIYSDADLSASHVFEADKAFRLPGLYSKDTYLDSKRIIEVARRADCDAIHPGYGFLSENADFSRLCRDNSIKFIGPSPVTLSVSGNKLECKKLAESRGIPVIPYSKEPIDDPEVAARFSAEIGFPVLLKSAFGGGGRGIKEARSKADVREAFESSEREAKAAFGRFSVFIERKLQSPRHIEIQIVASDDSSNVIHLGERECSIQRRYQKLVELSPSPVVDAETRKKVAAYATKIARLVHYSNAGTVEFLRDASGEFYFLEVNSRLQVEHPVTELVTGTDLVAAQIQVASRSRLPFSQKSISIKGCAIECRINAEDPLLDFLPVTGTVEYLRIPSGPGVRVDSALYGGFEMSPYYDSLLAKLICWGTDYDEARRRTLVALNEFKIAGLPTTIPFHRQIASDAAFAKGEFSTSFIEDRAIIRRLKDAHHAASTKDEFAIAALLLSRRTTGTPKPSIQRPAPLGGAKGGRFIDGL